jgi:deoxyhypusine synthase
VAFYQQKSLLIILTSLERSGEGSVFNLKAVVVAVGGGVAKRAMPNSSLCRRGLCCGIAVSKGQSPHSNNNHNSNKKSLV